MPMDIAICREKIVGKGEVPVCRHCGSFVKPDIVFFGEMLPSRFQDLIDADTSQADLLIVIGTSLMVMPVAGIPTWVSSKCPRILLNRELVGDFIKIQPRDVFLEGDCDAGAREICHLAGWETSLYRRFEECQQTNM
jgi:NAD-dependent SIR2 family protein deacetylase